MNYNRPFHLKPAKDLPTIDAFRTLLLAFGFIMCLLGFVGGLLVGLAVFG